MIALRIQVDSIPVQRQLSALEQTQLPFASSLALNNLAKKAQDNIRAHFRQVFTLRRPEFIEKQGVKIFRFATKRDPVVEFGVGPLADFLTKFEPGGARPKRSQHIAIPVDVRRNKRDIITRGNRPRPLIQRLGKKKGAGGVFRVTDERQGLTRGIYQRTGRKGRGGIKLLFALENTAQIPASLQFERIAKETAEREWPAIFEAALGEALRRAR